MNIYVLRRFNYDYNESAGFVIVAPSPKAARELASVNVVGLAFDKVVNAEFLDPKLSSCELVGKAAAKYTKPTVVLEDYLAG